MRVGSLFSGVGGLDLGLERAGMSVAWQCEIDPYCRAVLAHHWPGVVCYDDIRSIDDTAESVDLICGGFPCQPVSLAGKGLAQEDPRWLWPEFARVVGLLRPRYVLVENVPGLGNRGLGDVLGDLSALGYDAEWDVVPASEVGAPHLRERLFVVAYPHGEVGIGERAASEAVFRLEAIQRPRRRCDGSADGTREVLQDADGRPLESWWKWRRAAQASGFEWWPVEPDMGRVAHGVPNRLAQLRALGNAVVPQVAEFVGRLILEAEGVARAA